MESAPLKSRRNLLIGLAAAAGLVVIISLVAYAIFGSTKRENPAPDSESGQVATKDEVKKNLNDIEASLKKATADQNAAKAAQKDDKQVKVSS